MDLIRSVDVAPHAAVCEKFQSAVVVQDLVVMVPFCADKLVTFNPRTGELRGVDVAPHATGNGKFLSAVVVQDLVVMMPCNADKVVTFNPHTEELRGIDVAPHATGNNKFWSAVVVQDLVVMVPFSADKLVTFNPRTEELRGVDVAPHATGSGKFVSAVVVQDLVVMVPFCADKLVTFNPRTEELRGVDVAPHATVSLKFASAVVVQDLVVMVPKYADKVVTFNPYTEEVRGVDVTPHAPGADKFRLAVVVQDLVIMVPCDAHKIVTFNPRTDELRGVDVSPHATGTYKFLSAVVVRDLVVMVPYGAHKVLTFGASPLLPASPPPPALPATPPAAPEVGEPAGPGPPPAAAEAPPAGEQAGPGPPPAAAEAPPAAAAGRAERPAGSKRWGLGVEAPAAGARVFFPAGWVPDRTVREALAHARVREACIQRLEQMAAEKHDELTDLVNLGILAAAPPTRSQVLTIMAYTDEDARLYGTLNKHMRTSGGEAERMLELYRAYIHFLTVALSVLPTYCGTVFRAIDVRLAPELYQEGKVVTWQGFSSTTKESLRLVPFLLQMPGGALSGSVFVIAATAGKDVSTISVFPEEAEVLIAYNSFYKVTAVLGEEAAKRQRLPQLGGYRLGDLDVYVLEQLG